MNDASGTGVSRRRLLRMIGEATSSAVMYQAMTSLGHAADSTYVGPIELPGDPKGASILILGAGLAGMVAALELRKAGYKVKVLEYQKRAGGRNWTLRGGDSYVELGGARQDCAFDEGLYINPGPWRIPFHHRALLDYCKRLGVRLEPFIQLNFNSYLHASTAFGGKPQRFRHVLADYHGRVTELLAKAVNADRLDDEVSAQDKEVLLASLRAWGTLDRDYSYRPGYFSSEVRGYEKAPGGGVDGAPLPSTPLAFEDVLSSRLWRHLSLPLQHDFQHTMFQPVGGMDMIGKAFFREVGDVIEFGAKVTAIRQNENGVTVTYVSDGAEGVRQASADWCLCTIPLSILSQIELDVGAPMRAAIDAVPYAASLKIGLQFKRRFWEEDEAIYGGISYTDLPIAQISYPSTDYHKPGKGVLLGAYSFGLPATEFTSMTPAERVALAVENGAQLHPQYREEFENGIAVAWHRVPWTLGCFGLWNTATRAAHYQNLCAIDGRIVLAGEHASYVNAWQEGAILSSLDAITRLHKRVVTGK
ncbi:MAG: flavin monoamine oxidase family protein [Hyphomicrobiales bacterium]|nr:flavin monoamine oxidase family protein [Hyphomicrobiales bacterium]